MWLHLTGCCGNFLMSDLESTSTSSSEREINEPSDDSNDNYVFSGEYLPYQDEPLASDSNSHGEDGAEDEDGLSAAVLEKRFEKEITLDKWYV